MDWLLLARENSKPSNKQSKYTDLCRATHAIFRVESQMSLVLAKELKVRTERSVKYYFTQAMLACSRRSDSGGATRKDAQNANRLRLRVL